MPARYKDYPIYVYDEPAVYGDFTGGVNTHPNSETLKDNELSACINMTFENKTLCKRKGLYKESQFICEEDLHNIQGVFLLPINVTYIIVAADGKLYYGLYQKGPIELQKLHIRIPLLDKTILFNPQDTSIGLEEFPYILTDTTHDGYIHLMPDKDGDGEVDLAKVTDLNDFLSSISVYYELTREEAEALIILKERDPDNYYYYKGKVVGYTGATHTVASLGRLLITPLNTEYWQETTEPTDVSWEASMLYIPKNQVVLYQGKTYKCIASHYIYDRILNSFEAINSNKELIFQNKDKIEGATFQNVLYLTTGTRFVKVYKDNYELKATIVEPHVCNNSEIQYIGFNYLSPYPEFCRATQYNSASTAIGAVLTTKNIDGTYTLSPMMSFKQDSDVTHFSYKWEKCVNGAWYVVISFKDNLNKTPGHYYNIRVTDADKYLYRVTYADLFTLPSTLTVTDISTIIDWEDCSLNTEFNPGDWVKFKDKLYQCVSKHTKSSSTKIENTLSSLKSVEIKDEQGNLIKAIDYAYLDVAFEEFPSFMEATQEYKITTINADGYPHDAEYKSRVLWEPLLELEAITRCYTNPDGTITTEGEWDLVVEKAIATTSRASTVLFDNNMDIESRFSTIHSCKKIVTDGNKLLLYDDAYNTGCWFKTILNNPGYITDKGSLSFKTTKNEKLIKVVPYNTILIAFANSEGLGGSIHMVQGSGDDYDDGNYYSPYQRATMNTEVSCDNADTVQICEGLLLFKYYDTVYYISPSSSELNNESLFVYSANDKIKLTNTALATTLGCSIPWEDNSCVSEVTDSYYGLIWNPQYSYDNGEIYCTRPAIRVKLYYKMPIEDVNKYSMPWLIDDLGDKTISTIFTIEGQPRYLIDNNILSQHGYTDEGSAFDCIIYSKLFDMGYTKQVKFVNSLILSTQRDQEKPIQLSVIVRNEANYSLLDSSKKTLQQLRSAHNGASFKEGMKLGKTHINTTVYNMQYRYPCLNASTIIKATTEGWFTLSNLVFIYTSAETPDTTPFDSYTKILRKGDITT